MQFFVFLAIVIAIVLVVFAVQNATAVTLTFLAWEFSGSLAVILALTFALGVLTGILLSAPAWLKKTKEARQHRKRIQELERAASRPGTGQGRGDD
ncbi:MAG: LapA family protein [Nitrospirae bacterium]|nr:LapA family protein [Nitrospirota bacterium]